MISAIGNTPRQTMRCGLFQLAQGSGSGGAHGAASEREEATPRARRKVMAPLLIPIHRF